jgi:hypothetical protein
MELTAKPSNELGSYFAGLKTFNNYQKEYRTVKNSSNSLISFI